MSHSRNRSSASREWSRRKAIKRFKRMVEKEGIIREWKKREYYEKPSTILNRKNKALARKQMKKVRKMHASKAY